MGGDDMGTQGEPLLVELVDNSHPNGSLTIFERDGTGAWSEVFAIDGGAYADERHFGRDVGISLRAGTSDQFFAVVSSPNRFSFINVLEASGGLDISLRSPEGVWSPPQTRVLGNVQNLELGQSIAVSPTLIAASANVNEIYTYRVSDVLDNAFLTSASGYAPNPNPSNYLWLSGVELAISSAVLAVGCPFTVDGFGAVLVYSADTLAFQSVLSTADQSQQGAFLAGVRGDGLLVSKVFGGFLSTLSRWHLPDNRTAELALPGTRPARVAASGARALAGLPTLDRVDLLSLPDDWHIVAINESLVPTNGTLPAEFGHAVALSGTQAAIGAPGRNALFIFSASPCVFGEIYDPTGGTCWLCAPGSEPNAAADGCRACAAGAAAAPGGACASCALVAPDCVPAPGGDSCERCPLGGVPDALQRACVACEDGEVVVTPPNGRPFCLGCAAASRPNGNRTECVVSGGAGGSSSSGGAARGLSVGLSVGLSAAFCCLLALCAAACCALCCGGLVAAAVLAALLAVVVAMAASSGGLGGFAGLFALRLRKRNRMLETNLAIFEDYDGETMADGLEREFRELAFGDLAFDKKVGEGAFGRVFLGVWRGTTYVAIKELNVTADDKAKREFIHEANVMARVGVHPNVVHFIGAVITEERFYMVTEFAQNGSLVDFLAAHDSLSDAQIMQFARDAAAGIVHLHAEAIVHRDIAARNFLVAKDLTVAVADFGLSRIVDVVEGEDRTAAAARRTESNIGPIRWMAPESIRSREYSEASDVYMFGCFLFELATRGAVPFEGFSLHEVMLAVTQRRMRPSVPPSCPTLLSDIMRRCWREDPGSRPPMDFVYRKLQHAIEGTQLGDPADEDHGTVAADEVEVNYFGVGEFQEMNETDNLRAENGKLRAEVQKLKNEKDEEIEKLRAEIERLKSLE